MKNIKNIAKKIVSEKNIKSTMYTTKAMNFGLGPNVLFNDGTTGISFRVGSNSISMTVDEAEIFLGKLKNMISMARRNKKSYHRSKTPLMEKNIKKQSTNRKKHKKYSDQGKKNCSEAQKVLYKNGYINPNKGKN